MAGRKQDAARREAVESLIMKLSERPNGVTTLQTGHCMRYSHACAERLVREGKLFRVKFSHRSVAYFSDKRVAEALAHRPKHHHITINGGKASDPKVTWPDGIEAQITEKTVFTRCPGYPADAINRKAVSNW